MWVIEQKVGETWKFLSPTSPTLHDTFSEALLFNKRKFLALARTIPASERANYRVKIYARAQVATPAMARQQRILKANEKRARRAAKRRALHAGLADGATDCPEHVDVFRADVARDSALDAGEQARA